MKAFFSKIKPCFFVVLMGLTQHVFAQDSGVVLRSLDVNPILINAANQDKARVSRLQDVERPALRLPFFDDFSNLRSPFPNDSLWEDNLVFINASFPLFPPTIGVATFDALDASGRLYAHAAFYSFPADTLTSRPIRLDSVFDANPREITMEDSVFFSFYFQPGGGFGTDFSGTLRGLAPRRDDLLVLEFLNSAAVWNEVWYANGQTLELFCPLCVDETAADFEREFFRQVAILVSADYLHDAFQFRFRNYSSLDPTGNRPLGREGGGQWHIDYVRLDVYPNGFNPFSPDIAFVHQGERVLREFQAMPANQFQASDLVSEIPILFRNLDTTWHSTRYDFQITGPGFFAEAGPSFVDIEPFFTHGFNYGTDPDYDMYLFQRSVLSNFPNAITTPGVFEFQHILTSDRPEDIFRSNDTMTQTLHFGNYFAFDDGTPELGFGLSVLGTINPFGQFALQFPMRVADSLVGIQIWLNHTQEYTNHTSFNLAVWRADANGMPTQETAFEPLFLQDIFENADSIGFFTYWLDAPLALNPGSFFIGFQQRNNFFLNVGFDLNNNAENRMFRWAPDIDMWNPWQQLFMYGAVMMRPIFGTSETIPPPPTHIVDRENIVDAFENIRVFPNPVTDELHIVIPSEARDLKTVELFDINGRRLLSQRVETGHAPSLHDDSTVTIDMSHLPSGIYILVLHTENGIVTKQIIRR